MATDLNKTLGYYQPFEWNQIPPTPIISYPAVCPALSRRDFFILAALLGLYSTAHLNNEDRAKQAVLLADVLLREADETQ